MYIMETVFQDYALPLSDPLAEVAKKEFGLSFLFPFQRLVVCNILDGRDQLVILPTGSGKSLCFSLPAVLLDGLTVIVYPLRSLIADQHRRLVSSGLDVEMLIGGMEGGEKQRIMRRLACAASGGNRGNGARHSNRSGAGSDRNNHPPRILLTNPESLITPRTFETLKKARIDHLVVDESHVLPEWGTTFRPAYIRLAQCVTSLAPRIVSAFTATASPHIVSEINRLLFNDDPPHIVAGIPDRPNIHYTIKPTLSKSHDLRFLASSMKRPGIIFCRSRAGTEVTAQRLRYALGDERIRFYHAGLDREERKAIEEWFFDASDAILTATCAYGMGVDKADIRTVVHRDAPASIEAYLQETGRAGRDRNESIAVTLFSYEDLFVPAGNGIPGTEGAFTVPGDSDSRPFSGTTNGDNGSATGIDDARSAQQPIAARVARERQKAFIEFLTNPYNCRRRGMMELLGAPAVDCSGCDVCDGTVLPYPAELHTMLDWIGRNGLRYGRKRTIAALRHELSNTSADGSLWTEDEVAEALGTLTARGAVRKPRTRIGKRCWPDRLTVASRLNA